MNHTESRVALGLDFGTESVRALMVDLQGQERASAVASYPHGQITERLPTTQELLPPHFALQHPQDWIEASAQAVSQALERSHISPAQIVGIGVDFTSCTMLPAQSDGTPLCLLPQFAHRRYAWPKLWKHHGAQTQTERLNRLARQRHESWLARYGGTIGLEWFFPKILETLEEAPDIYQATDVWLEAGDWYVWQLVGSSISEIPRSTCQAGYKALWSAEEGYPSRDFFRAVHPQLADVAAQKMPGRLCPPGNQAGTLCQAMAKRLGLPAGIPVSAAVIDAHAGVPGAGAAGEGVLVMVMGTSSCHMINSKQLRDVPGVAGVVKDGILPGYYGYETGQAAVGDLFDWVRRLVGHSDFASLTRDAEALEPGAQGVLCLDWMNGCRTPLMDGSLHGAFTGLALHHGPPHLYRAAMEASAFGFRWIVELLQQYGVEVRELLATGGLPHHNRLLMQIYADVMGETIAVHPSQQGPALGAAILGVLAAGTAVTGFANPEQAIRAMATTNRSGPDGLIRYTPDRQAHAKYENIYRDYRQLASQNTGHHRS